MKKGEGGEENKDEVSLQTLSKKMDDFAKARDWEKYHSPRNLLLAMVGEVGELSEIFQWKGEVAIGCPDWKEEEKVHLGEELSDVLLYLVRLSDACGVDLGKAALRKIELNAIKYPALKQTDDEVGDGEVSSSKIKLNEEH
ncbi:PREDICTED: dCTP pyrophosphatase 1-like [Camelina sativa]|uniref:dCTP pyrophosphatase 1 n=1 Tax=Camelina sativa TaxID=90675 RepID=A0ABM0ZD69_CAMSA|nr:PREDICTED: dCTP pyrophosphatase 1-like [Camelina sativa]